MENEQEKLIYIALPENYWVIVLEALNNQWKISKEAIAKLKERGLDQEEIKILFDEKKSALAGPLIVQAIIVNSLIDQGILSLDAKELKDYEDLQQVFQIQEG